MKITILASRGVTSNMAYSQTYLIKIISLLALLFQEKIYKRLTFEINLQCHSTAIYRQIGHFPFDV